MSKEKQTSTYSHILKYTSVFGGVQGLNIIISLVRNKLVAIILGPTGMGLMSIFNSTIKLISDTINMGIPISGVRTISQLYDERKETELLNTIKTIRSWSVLLAIIGMFVCILFSSFINDFTFKWGNHTIHYILLSPVIALTIITSGELAILKGIKQLKSIAYITICNIFFALLTSVPLYWLYGESAIIPSLIIMALTQMLLTIWHSNKCYNFNVSFKIVQFRNGIDMIKLGFAFMLAGFVSSGGEFVVRSYLNTTTYLDVVGLYNAGYMITMTYAGMVFSSMESDYFPRLSSVCNDIKSQNITVNKQIEISMLLMFPLLVLFLISLPILLPLLFSSKFLPVISMVQITIFALYFRAVALPIAYIPLAKGDSKSFLFLEGIYSIILVLSIIFFFKHWQLTGCGVAIAFASMFDLIIILIYASKKYRYSISKEVVKYIFIIYPAGIVAYLITFIDSNSLLYWLFGGIMSILSCIYSLNILNKKTEIISVIKTKFFK